MVKSPVNPTVSKAIPTFDGVNVKAAKPSPIPIVKVATSVSALEVSPSLAA